MSEKTKGKKKTARGAKKKQEAQADQKPKHEPINPPKNRRLWSPGKKTLSILLDGSKRISPADRLTFDRLIRLVIDLQIFFGQDRQTAALFLFSIWMDCYHSGSVWDARRASPDLDEVLKQFGRDVVEATRPKRKPGRKRKPLVTKLKELKERGYSIRQGCEMEIPGFTEMDEDTQNIIIRGNTEAVGKRTRRDRKDKEVENEPDKLQ